MKLGLIAGALALIAGAPAYAENLDMVCQAHVTNHDAGANTDIDLGDETIRYRLDLSSMRYCDDECENQHPFKATAEEYVFANADGEADTFVQKINRQSGALTYKDKLDDGSVTTKTGPCHQEAFSGFPRAGR
jgi:hypothetical protein